MCGIARLIAGDLDDAFAGDAAETGDALDFVLLEEKLDAFGVFVDDLLLAILSGLEVELHATDVDPEFFRAVDVLEDVGVFEERFGRNAAAMRAGATKERILLDDGHLHSELTGADAGDIAARTAADDHDVELLICHEASSRTPPKRGSGLYVV